MVRKRNSKSASLPWLAVVVVVVATMARPVDADSTRADIDLIQGTWKLIELSRGNGPEPAEGTLSIKGTKATIKVKIPDLDPYEKSYQFKLYPFREPKAFDVIWDDGRVTRGIYFLEGNTWHRCHGIPDGERPTNFDIIAGGGMISSLWKRPEIRARPKSTP